MSTAPLTICVEPAPSCALVGAVPADDAATETTGAFLGLLHSVSLKRFEPMVLKFSDGEEDTSVFPTSTPAGFKLIPGFAEAVSEETAPSRPGQAGVLDTV